MNLCPCAALGIVPNSDESLATNLSLRPASSEGRRETQARRPATLKKLTPPRQLILKKLYPTSLKTMSSSCAIQYGRSAELHPAPEDIRRQEYTHNQFPPLLRIQPNQSRLHIISSSQEITATSPLIVSDLIGANSEFTFLRRRLGIRIDMF
jgi:hypothetical protein